MEGRLPFCKRFKAMSKDMHLGLRVLRVQGEGCRRCVFLIRVLHPQCYTPVTLRAVTPRVGGRQNFNIFTRQDLAF